MCRRTWYQYYTNVTFSTDERCLAWHGAIRKEPTDFPSNRDPRERLLLPIPPRDRRAFREKARRMRVVARAELTRRKLFEAGEAALEETPEQAVASLRQAARIDVYLPELERLVERHRERLRHDPALREDLRMLFVGAFSDKFGCARYERLPEVMRLRLEEDGVARIDELFR